VTRLFLGAAGAVLAAVVVAAPSSACGCGIALQATVPTERALIVTGNGQEQLIVSFDVLSSGAHGAVVLPVPARPTVDAVKGDLFGYLERATAPPPTVGTAPDDAAGAAPLRGVHVISNRRIGGYQVATLAADSNASALSDWLTQHRYTLPDGARPILASYLTQGWDFVAVRLTKKADGTLAPLRISFTAKKAIYPMRLEQLGREPVNVNLWVVGDRHVSVPPLHEAYSGAVAKLDPAVPKQLKGYLDGTWITRADGDNLEPATLTSDFVALPDPEASSSAPHQPHWWVWLLLGAGVAVVGAYAARATRRSR